MKQKFTALLLVLMLLSTIMVSAFATDAPPLILAKPETAAAPETPAAEPQDSPAADRAPDSVAEVPAEVPVIETPEASPNAVMFVDLADKMKKNSPSYRALMANAEAIDEASDQVDDLQDALAKIHAGIDQIDDQLAALEDGGLSAGDQAAAEAALQAQKAELQSQAAQVQSGISGLNAMAGQDTTQLEGAAKQMILGCESMYIALVGLEIQETALVRQLAALDRTLAELKVRQEWGQISQLQLMEAESGRTALVSGLTTLRMNMTNLRMQLESMLGEKITGTFEVGTLPRVTAEQLSAIDADADLKLVLRRSPDIQAAENQEDSLRGSGLTGDLLDSMSAAADYGIESARLQAEMNFRSLYAELMDCRQALSAATSALEVEQRSYQAQELKYSQGTISKNALLTAADELQTAKEAVLTAENTLFSTYNEYNWAVKHGIFM